MRHVFAALLIISTTTVVVVNGSPVNCTTMGAALCDADGACEAFGVYGDKIQLHGCNATVPNTDWSTYVHNTANGDYSSLPGVNIDETQCTTHARTGLNHACSSPPPSPTPTPSPLYTKVGAIDVDTFENTIFYFRGVLCVLVNIPCSYPDHAGVYWPEIWGNHSYARIQDFSSGLILVNITSTIGFGFISAYPDYDSDTLWLFGTPADRCAPNSPNGSPTTVQSWWSTDAALQIWGTALTFDLGKVVTHNVQVTKHGPRGGAPLKEVSEWKKSQDDNTGGGGILPFHTHAMFLECFTWLIIDASADANLTKGWRIVNATQAPPGGACGGPSFTYSPADDFYYILTGGHTVKLFRTLDFMNWTESTPSPFISPSFQDAFVSPYNGFAAAAKHKGSPPAKYVGVPEPFPFVPFDPVWTENWESWNNFSNDADFCCMHADLSNISYVIWGASTQGRVPQPPLTGSDASTNSIGVAAMPLIDLLAAYFV